MNNKKSIIIFLLLALLFLYLRVVHINADAPHNISFSGGVFSDEGAYSVNARNKVLYGTWFTDQWNDMYYNPSLTFIRYIVFNFFNAGIAQQRIISVIFSMLSIILIYHLLAEDYNNKTAFLGFIFLGFNYLYVFFSRNGLLDVPALTISTLFLYCFQKGFKIKHYFFYAGVFTVFTYSFKNLYAYLLPVTIVSYIIYIFVSRIDYKKHLKPLSFLISGYVFSYLSWYFLHFLPLRSWIIDYAGSYMKDLALVKSIGHAWYNFKTFPVTQYYGPLGQPVQGIFVSMPVIYMLGFIFVAVFIYLVFYRRSYIKPTDIISFTYYSAAFLFVLFLLAYRPTRYFLPFVIPLSVMAARSIDLFLKIGRIEFPRVTVKNLIFTSFLYIWGFFLYYLCILPFYFHYSSRQIPDGGLHIRPSLISWTILYIIIAGIIFYLGHIKGKTLTVYKIFPQIISIILVILSLSVNLYFYSKWYRAPDYDAYSSAIEIRDTLPEDSVMAGLIAPVLAMESRIRPFFIFENFMNYENNPCIRHNVTHAILGLYNNEVSMFYNTCPERERKATLIRVFNIFKKNFLLYSFVFPILEKADIVNLYPDSMDMRFRVYFPSYHYADTLEIGGFLLKDGRTTELESFKADIWLPFEENEFLATLPYGYDDYEGAEIFFYLDIEESALRRTYYAKDLQSQTGIEIYDNKIFNDIVMAGRANIDHGDFLTHGPYTTWEQGMGIARFFIGFDNLPNTETDVFVVDITADARSTIANRDFKTSDLMGIQGNLLEVPLRYFVNEPKKIEFRTYFFSTVDLFAHRIEVEFFKGRYIRIEKSQ